jgi:hypothetical protein
MTPPEYNQDLFFQELFELQRLCTNQGVSWEETTCISGAPAFAQGLILCPDTDAATKHIGQNPEGASGFVCMVDGLVQGPCHMPLELASMPTQNRTPFYVLSAMVLDMEKRDPSLSRQEFSDASALHTRLNSFFRAL